VFGVLAREALGDAVRRRIVLAIAVACLLSLQVIESCTSCGSASFTRDGQSVALPELAGLSALVIAVAGSLWTLLLAGVLASDHLAEPLADGSATLVLARPVGRGSFALARLAGALAIALPAGALLLFATAALGHARHALPWLPVVAAFAATAAGASSVAALAMAASLALPRIASLLLVLMGVGAVAAVNVAAQLGAELGGVAGLVDRFGPPLVSSVVVALRAWIEPANVRGAPVELALRQAVWMLASAVLLVRAFHRVEIRG
jgi:hypothetical protein